MRLRQLEYVDYVLRHQSLTKAADALFVAVPTLSQQIRLLEEELGVTLINRRGRGMKATSEGEMLIEDIRKVLQAARDLKLRAGDLANNHGGQLRIGTTHSAAITILPRILAGLNHRCRNVMLRIEEGSSWGILARLASGELDVGLVAVSSLIPMTLEDLSVQPLLQGELMACCSTKFKSLHCVSLKDLRRHPLILFHQGTLVYDLLRKSLPPEAFTENSVYYTDNSDSAREMVSRGLGIAFLPNYASSTDVYYHLGRVKYLRIDAPPIPIGIGVAHNNTHYVPSLVHQFEEVSKLEAQRFMESLETPRPLDRATNVRAD